MGKIYTAKELLKMYVLNDLKKLNLKRVFHFLKIFAGNKIGVCPFNLLIETSNLCNLNCESCPTPRRLINRPRKNMSLKTFKKIIDNSHSQIYRVILHWTNEPLTNKNLSEFIKYSNQKHLFTTFSTNGILLDKKVSEKLLLAGLDKIEICLDGMCEDSFKKFRGSNKFQAVKKNIIDFIKLRNKLNKDTVVEIQMIINAFNEPEVEKAKKFVKEIGADKLFLKSFGVSKNFYSKEERTKLLEKFIPAKKSTVRRYDMEGTPIVKIKKCNAFKSTLPVTVDGRITPCCQDFQSLYYLGNLKNSSLKEILNSKKAKSILDKAGRLKLSLCKNC